MIDRLHRHWAQIALGVLVVAAFLSHTGGFVRFEFVDRLEHLAYDARLLWSMPRGRDDRVIIVDIDEKSLAEEGRWPWGRDKLALLVQSLFDDYGAGLVGFDVFFPEADESSGLSVLRELAEGPLKDNAAFKTELESLAPTLDNDAIFAATIARYPVVLGYYFSDAGKDKELKLGSLPPPAFSADHFAGRRIPFKQAFGYGGNLPKLQAAALGGGHVNPEVDADGVVRKVPMLYKYDNAYYEALSLAMSRLALGIDSVTAGFPADSKAGGTYQGMEWIQLGERTVPVDEQVRALVPYRGRQGAFPYISATDVLNGTAPKDVFRERIVLVGTSAPGLLDLRSTPVQAVYPGVEIHANLIAGILDNVVLEDPAYTLGAEFVITLVFGLALAAFLPTLTPALATVFMLGLLVTYTALNLWTWSQENLVFALAPGLLMILVLYLVNMSWGFFVESRGKRQLAGLFGQYIPPELVDEMSLDPSHYSMEAASREMTVLFTDVRGFTTISEGLDPKELSELMSEFLTPMTQIIHRNRGTIDKYMGDAIMCFWGAPLADPEHASRAVGSALEMVEAVSTLGDKFRARGWPEIRIGVGVNTGEMSVGNMGSEFRRAYTVLGDAVNLGSRLEGQTKNYGVDVIVNETTRTAARDFAYRELDRIRVKGKDEPVTIYEPICAKENLSEGDKEELRLYRQALKLYRAQNWDSAEIQFLNLRKTHPNRPLYAIYVERIAAFRQASPGEGWDGVFTHTTK